MVFSNYDDVGEFKGFSVLERENFESMEPENLSWFGVKEQVQDMHAYKSKKLFGTGS